MPGVLGAGGPVPKRSNKRRRQNKPTVPVDSAPASSQVEVPKANSKWHPVAKRWYESLVVSGQAVYYEPSDWATAYLIAESMSRDLKPQFVGVNEVTGDEIVKALPLKGANLSAYLKAFTVLLATEGDRRRLRLELERGDQGPAKGSPVALLDEFRDARSS